MQEEISRVLSEIEQRSKSQFLPIIGPEKAKVLIELIERHKPIRILEVGTLVGYSAIVMASWLPEHSSIVTIEKNPKFAEIAKENFKKAKLAHKIEILVSDAKEAIPKLQGKFNMLFLDAEKGEYINYLKLAEPFLLRGSVVVADNVKVFANELQNYLDYVKGGGEYNSQTQDVAGDAMEISLKIY